MREGALFAAIVLGCVACSAFGSSDDATPGTAATARILCDGAVCTDGKICCEHDDGRHECTAREACSADDELPIFCTVPSDCGAGGSCCVRVPDGYHVDSVACGTCATDTRTHATCDPQRPSCGAGSDCVTLDSVSDNSLGLDVYVCK